MTPPAREQSLALPCGRTFLRRMEDPRALESDALRQLIGIEGHTDLAI